MSAVPLRKKAPPRPLATISVSEPALLSIPQAAKRIGISTRSAYQWAHADELPGLVRMNGRLYVKRMALDRFLDSD